MLTLNHHKFTLQDAYRRLDTAIADVDRINEERKRTGLEVRQNEVSIEMLSSFLREFRLRNIHCEGQGGCKRSPNIAAEKFSSATKAAESHTNSATIAQRLKDIEEELQVKIIFAAEVSSR